MGKIILCKGRTATEPYRFPISNAAVFSIEELSLYLYEHIFELYEDLLTDELIQWVEDELEMTELAKKLADLKENGNNLVDIIVTILCSNDYYTEREIKELVNIMDQIMNLPKKERKKIKGDQLLKYKMYAYAIAEYHSLLYEEKEKLSNQEFGIILHNLAVAHIHVSSYREAALEFKRAYSLTQNTESLHQYLLALLLSGQQEQAEKEIEYYELGEQYFKKLTEEIMRHRVQAVQQKEYQEICKMAYRKEDGKKNEFYQEVDLNLYEWKQEYRKQIEG